MEPTSNGQGAAGSAIVEVRDVTKVFRDFWMRPRVKAVDHLDLTVRPGEIFGLLGPNGSGKSTTIKMLLGLLRPTTGTMSVLGRSPQDVGSKTRIGYLPEESYLYHQLTSRETLDFYGRLFDLDSRERKRRVDQLLEMVGLASAADRPVGEFSKGMARRIGLAQALINDPQLLILDEPTAGMDPIGCREIKDLMLILARRGKTILLSSHLLADVEDVCHRVAVLFNGRLQALGELPHLLQKQDRVRITVPSMPADVLKEVLRMVREKAGSDPEVDHPSMDLEQFFVEVVQRAHRDGETSGASPTWKMAEYLEHA